jgi:hypothetical protein
MPGNRPHHYRAAPVLTRLLTPGHFLLRPQLLTRLSACARARRSRRLLASIGRACSPLEEVRLRAGTLVSQLFSKS